MNPGTVSKILWHFTGGPQWDKTINAQSKKRKPKRIAYKNLISILDTKELRIGNYKELAKFRIRKYVGRDENKKHIYKDQDVKIFSHPVCCVADIPLMHLKYYSKRYGELAIGFQRESIVKNGFNPVLYTLNDSNVSKIFYDGLKAIETINIEYFEDSVKSKIDDIKMDLDNRVYNDDFPNTDDEIKNELIDIHSDLESIQFDMDYHIDNQKFVLNEGIVNLKKVLAFIKTFSTNEFESIYCEREWRSLNPYSFQLEDIALIIAPRKGGYFDKLCNFIEKKIRLPRNISVNAWEDLIEH